MPLLEFGAKRKAREQVQQACSLADGGRFGEAESALRRGFASTEKMPGLSRGEVGFDSLKYLYDHPLAVEQLAPLVGRSLDDVVQARELGKAVMRCVDGLAGFYVGFEPEKSTILYWLGMLVSHKVCGSRDTNWHTSVCRAAIAFADRGACDVADMLLRRANETITSKPELEVVFIDRAVAAGNPSKEAALYRTSVALRDTALGAGHLIVGASRYNLASLYNIVNRFDEAESIFQQALATFETALGKDHDLVAATLLMLAFVYMQQKKAEQAVDALTRSMAITERSKPHQAIMAKKLCMLGDVFRAMERYEDAETVYRQALTIYEENAGPSHPCLVMPLESYADILRAGGRNAEAKEIEARALDIQESTDH